MGDHAAPHPGTVALFLTKGVMRRLEGTLGLPALGSRDQAYTYSSDSVLALG